MPSGLAMYVLYAIYAHTMLGICLCALFGTKLGIVSVSKGMGLKDLSFFLFKII